MVREGVEKVATGLEGVVRQNYIGRDRLWFL